MCRRSRDDASARNATSPTKLAAQDAADHCAVRRQCARSIPAVPAPAGTPGMASPWSFAGEAVVVGSDRIPGRALHRSGEIPAGIEPRWRGHRGATGCAMLFCRLIRFAVSAFTDWRRYFARGHGAACGEKQSWRSARKFGGPYFGFCSAGIAGWNRRGFGAGLA